MVLDLDLLMCQNRTQMSAESGFTKIPDPDLDLEL